MNHKIVISSIFKSLQKILKKKSKGLHDPLFIVKLKVNDKLLRKKFINLK